MHSLIRSAAIFLLLLSIAPLQAEPVAFGEPFPLTSTRYGSARGFQPILTSNGHEPVVFWSADRVRISRYTAGAFTPSRAIVPADGYESYFDVLWTGRHFLVVSAAEAGIVGRLIAGTGEPIGEHFLIAEGRHPHIAFSGRNVLLLFVAPSNELNALLLTPDGRAAEPAPRPLGLEINGRVAVASNGTSFAALVPRPFGPRLLFFDANGFLTADSEFGELGSSASIGTDGDRYFAVAACGQGPCGGAYGRIIGADGSLGAPVELHGPYPRRPSVVWSGTNWLVSYLLDTTVVPSVVQVVQLDATAKIVQQRRERSGSDVSIARVGDRVMAAWVADRYFDAIHVGGAELDAPAVASITAKSQGPPEVVASDSGTLVVWSEVGDGKTTVHVGVRFNDGRWTEREFLTILPRDCFYCYEESINTMVAGDGREYILYTSDPYERFVYRLDANGAQIGDRIAIPHDVFASHVLWSGHDYLFISGDSVTRMSASGTFSPPMRVPALANASAIATDGNGGLIAVRITSKAVNHYIQTDKVTAMRFGRDLQPLDAAPIELAVDDPYLAATSVGWDGRQYVVAWYGRAGVMAAQIAASGAPNPRVINVASERAYRTQLVAVDGGAALQWHVPHARPRFTVVRHNGSVGALRTISVNGVGGELVSLRNGDVAFVEAAAQTHEPYDNISRITMTLAASVPLPDRPEAPSARLQGRTLQWAAPRQEVDGYRVEFRRANAPWTEISTLLAPEARSVEVPFENGVRYEYRVRAWNSAGIGAYSAPIVVNGGGKRRAVR